MPRLLVIAEIALVFSIFRDVAYVTTYRLYISHRVDDASRSITAQRFDIEGARVVPQITMHPMSRDDRVAFRTALGIPSVLRIDVRPEGHARYQIHWRSAAADRILVDDDAAAATSVAVPIPADAGVVELVSQGRLTWVDPRLVGNLRVTRRAIGLALLLLVSTALARRSRDREPRLRPQDAGRMIWFRRIALTAGVLFTVASLEIGLRALGDRVPLGIASERHDLGEVRKDPRWEDTLRYGRRLRTRVDAVNEWRGGDIVRMGYIPFEVSDGVMHRFRFQTDDEGFRNARTRDRIDVAALGDSFTDAMTIDAHDGWTSVLERRTGLRVQNYGTAGFGPQQELRVLTDYVVGHLPGVVGHLDGQARLAGEAHHGVDRPVGDLARLPGRPAQHPVEPVAPADGDGHRRPQALGPPLGVEVVGDPGLPEVVGHGDGVTEAGDLPRQAHPGRDDELLEGVGAVARHGADRQRVEVVDALGGEPDVEAHLRGHEGGGVAEGGRPVEEGDDRGILSLDLLELHHRVHRPH